MRIGIYIETVKVSAKTGISRYVIGLVEALLAENTSHTFYLYYQKDSFFASPISWLKDHPNVKHRPLYSPGNIADSRPRLWWDHLLPFYLKRDRLDVFHGPNHFLPDTKVPTVLTIHDIAYYFMTVHGPGLDRILKNWTQKSIERATSVITVSDSTKADCIKEGCPADKLITIYQGFEANSAPKQHKQVASEPYILFLGTIQPRKNVGLLIDAYAQIHTQIPHKLILAGAPGDSFEQMQERVAALGLGEKVEFTGYIDDAQRQSLYEQASCFVYPSKYEGFGLVVLEAMSYSVPVITTNNSSLPEACGDAGILVEEDSPQELANALTQLLNNESMQQELVNKGLAHIKKFTWESCAKQTLATYEKVGNQ